MKTSEIKISIYDESYDEKKMTENYQNFYVAEKCER